MLILLAIRILSKIPKFVLEILEEALQDMKFNIDLYRHANGINLENYQADLAFLLNTFESVQLIEAPAQERISEGNINQASENLPSDETQDPKKSKYNCIIC